MVRHIDEFTAIVNKWIEADGKLSNGFKAAEEFEEQDEDEPVAFEAYYSSISKWMLQQKEIPLDHLLSVAEKRKKEAEMAQFKRD